MTTSTAATELVANIHDLILRVQTPDPGPRMRRPKWGACRGDLIPFGHDDLFGLNELAEAVAEGAEASGLGHILRSIGPGYGPAFLPADELQDPEGGDGGGVVFLPTKFPAWRGAVGRLLDAAADLDAGLTPTAPVPADEGSQTAPPVLANVPPPAVPPGAEVPPPAGAAPSDSEEGVAPICDAPVRKPRTSDDDVIEDAIDHVVKVVRRGGPVPMVKDVAVAVGCHVKYLSSSKRFRDFRDNWIRDLRSPIRRGQKVNGVVEAEDHTDE